MTSQPRFCVLAVIAFIGIQIHMINGNHIKLSPHFHLDYQLIHHDRTIEFIIKARGVTGWVGIGINNRSANMDGADIYMGGQGHDGEGYGKGYYVPFGGGNRRPTENPHQIWETTKATEDKGTTSVTVRRFLKVDERYGIIIENKSIHLIWAYNTKSDDVTKIHSGKGTRLINFIDKHNGTSRMELKLNTIFLFGAFITIYSKPYFQFC